MRVRVLRGRVLGGRENDFIELSRGQVAAGARAPGLLAFMAGYRRAAGAERFIMVSTWETPDDALRAAGDNEHPRALDTLQGVIEMDDLVNYDLIEPVFHGILDAPGAVIRYGTASVRRGKRDALFEWLDQKERAIRAQRWLLGWVLGERRDGDEIKVAAASAWASPLLIEQFAQEFGETGGATIFAELDDIISDFVVEQYQAVELQLPSRLADLGSRRVIAARFDSAELAASARAALDEGVGSANEAGISIARLAGTGIEGASEDTQLLVARVSLAEYPQAERLIADLGGQVILATDELRPKTDQLPTLGVADLNHAQAY